MKTYLTSLGCLLLLFCSIDGYGQRPETIPFQLAGKLLIVEATVDGQPGNFILDTGVAHLILNQNYFPGEYPEKEMHGIFGAAGEIQGRYSRFQLGKLNFGEVYAQTLSLQHIERAKGRIIHGLIGTQLLRNYELFVDLSKRSLTLFPIDPQGATGYAYPTAPHHSIPFRWKGDLPCLDAEVGGNRLTLLLDTGAEIGLLNANQERRLASHLTPQRKTTTNVVTFTPQKQRLTVSVLQDMQLAGWDCAAWRTVFGTMRLFNDHVPGPFLDGLVGYEVLSPYRFAINFGQRIIHVWLDEPQSTVRFFVRHE